MKRIIKWVALLLVILAAGLAAVPFLIDVNRFKPTLESTLTAALHRDVKLGNINLSLLSGSVEASDLEIADDAAFGKAPFLRAKAIRVGVELQPLIFSRKLNVTGITIEKPEISLMQTPAGSWNYSSLGTDASPSARSKPGNSAATAAAGGIAFTVSRLNIVDGSLTIGRTTGKWKPLVLDKLNIEVKDFSALSSFPFTLSTDVKGGGSIKLDGKAGPINATDASMTPATVKVHVTGLNLAGTGLVNYAPDMAGIISLDGDGETNGNNLKVNGEVTAEKLKLSKTGTPATIPVQIHFDVDHNMRKHSGVVKRGDIHIGKAPASVTGSYYEQGTDMMLKMNLDAPNMAVSEIVSMLGPLGIVLPSGSSLQGGTINTKLAVEGPADKLVTVGSLAVRETKLVGFDLGKNMSLVTRLAGIKTSSDTAIENVSLNVNVSPTGIVAKDIQLIVPTIGELRGDGTVDPANALDFKMTAAIHTSGIALLISDKPIPFFIQGTSASPQFKPDMKAIVAQPLNAVKDTVKKEGAAAAGNLLKGLLGGKDK